MIMNLQNLTPFNWFKRENEGRGDHHPTPRDIDPFARMHREMDRMFEDFFGGSRAGDGLLLKPSVDIAESKKAYKISVEIPGIEPDQIDLHIEGDTLVLSGEKRQESEDDDEGFHRVERSYGQFRRVLTLPEDADADGIKADFNNGVVKIKVPRLKQSEKAGAKKVKIEGSGN
jgi:HSP20 family protein